MLRTYAASAIVLNTRAMTDQDQAGHVDDSQIFPFIDTEYQLLRREIADICPDLYTVYSADLTVAGGAQTISLASITDLSKIRTVERKDGTLYNPLDMMHAASGSHPGALSWSQRGITNVDLGPPELAPGTYRIKYVSTGAIIAAGGDSVVVPAGGNLIIAHRVAAGLIRPRFEESRTAHREDAERLWNELKVSITHLVLSTPRPIRDVGVRRY